MREGELINEMATALDLDYTTSTSADSFTVGRETCEAMGTIFQEDEATSKPYALTISMGGTPEPARSSEGHGQPFPNPSHEGGSDFCTEDVRSSTVRIKDNLPKHSIEEMPEPSPSHVEGPLLEAETDWAKTKLLLAERLRFWSQEEGSNSLRFKVEQLKHLVEGASELAPSQMKTSLPEAQPNWA